MFSPNFAPSHALDSENTYAKWYNFTIARILFSKPSSRVESDPGLYWQPVHKTARFTRVTNKFRYLELSVFCSPTVILTIPHPFRRPALSVDGLNPNHHTLAVSLTEAKLLTSLGVINQKIYETDHHTFRCFVFIQCLRAR